MSGSAREQRVRVLQAAGCVRRRSPPAPLRCAALLCPQRPSKPPSRKNLELGCEDSRWLVSPGSSAPRAAARLHPGRLAPGPPCWRRRGWQGWGRWRPPARFASRGAPAAHLRRPPGWPRLCLAWVSQSEALPDGSRVPSFILDRCPPVSLLWSDSISCCPGRACADTFLAAHAGCPAPGRRPRAQLPGPLASSELSPHKRDCCVTCCTTFYFRWE